MADAQHTIWTEHKERSKAAEVPAHQQIDLVQQQIQREEPNIWKPAASAKEPDAKEPEQTKTRSQRL